MDRHTLDRSVRTAQMAETAPPRPSPTAEGIPFEVALTFIKLGYRAQRAGWNGKGMWIAIQVSDAHSKMTLPYIFMKTADDKLVPWLASQTDILAHDWAIVDDSGIEIVHGVGATPLGNQ
jgi:hypothetical protein